MSSPDSIIRRHGGPFRRTSTARSSSRTTTATKSSLCTALLTLLLLLCSFLPSCRCKSGSDDVKQQNFVSKRIRMPRRSLQSAGDHAGGAIQSGPDDGPSYAAAAVYNVASETLHITGTTYGGFFTRSGTGMTVDGTSSSCFYAVVSVDADNNNAMDWVTMQHMGINMVDEACQNLYMDDRNKRMYITSQTQPNGMLKNLTVENIGGENQVQLGMILDFEFDSDNSWSELQLVGGHVLQDDSVVYPVALAGEAGNGDVIYQVSMDSYDFSRNNLPSTDPMDATQPLDPVDHYLYGKEYYIRVTGWQTQPAVKYSSMGVQKTLQKSWGGETLATSDGEAIFVSGIVTTGENVYVSGTTKGAGDSSFGVPLTGIEVNDGDYDGFVTKFSPGGYDPMVGVGGASHPAYRVAAATGTNDWVDGICTSGDVAARVDAPNFIYITGATGGLITRDGKGAMTTDPITGQEIDEATLAARDDKVRAYLAKISTLTMTLEWAVNFESDAMNGFEDENAVVRGISCASTSNGEAVFVAGVVESDSVLRNSETTESMGGTDLFVAKVMNNGTVSFIRQMGSSQDDTVAKRGGIATMPNGDAIIVGNTKGAMYRRRDQDDPELGTVTDILAFTVNGETGAFVFPLEHEKFSGELPPTSPLPPLAPPTEPVPPEPAAPAPEPTAPPQPAPSEPAAAPTLPTDTAPAPSTPISNPTAPPPTPIMHIAHKTPSESESSGNGSGVEKWVILLLVLLGGILAIFCSAWYVNTQVMSQKEIGTDRSKVLAYLHGFDVEDVDLKHSATGGWHCSYANALAQGINNASSSRTNSSSTVNTSGDGLLGPDDDADAFDPLTASSLTPLDTGSRSNNSLFGDSLSNHHQHNSDNIIEAEGITFGGARSARPRLTKGASKRMASGHAGLGGSNAQYDGLTNSSSFDSDGSSPRNGSNGSSPPSSSSMNATSRKKEQWGRDII